MNIQDKLALVIGAINFIALLIVAWQTYLTRKSVQIAERNFLESRQIKELTSLPKACHIISVQNHLRNWKEDLNYIIDNEDKIKKSIKSKKDNVKLETKHYSGNMKLIGKAEFDFLPDWLKEILIIGARYYYEAMCLTNYVCSSKEEKDIRLSIIRGMVERAHSGINAISEMQKYFYKLIPDWYLECSASLDDSDYLY